MKKYLMLLLFLFSTSSFAFSEQELIKQLQQPQNVQGDFVQQRYLKALPTPITTTGVFTLIANKGLLWHMQTPFESITKVTPQGIMQWNNTTWVNSDKIGQGEQIRLFLGLLSGNIDGLKSQFSTNVDGSSEKWQLKLVPNSMLMQQIFTEILVKGGHLVEVIELHEKQGDRTVIQLLNSKQNQTLSNFVQQSLN